MVIIGTLIVAVMSLVMSFVSLLMAGGGLIWCILILIIFYMLADLIKKLNKPKEVSGKEEKNETEVLEDSSIYYRYRLYDISKKEVVAMTNYYERAFIMKQQLGPSVMIQDDWGFKHDRKNVSNCRKIF